MTKRTVDCRGCGREIAPGLCLTYLDAAGVGPWCRPCATHVGRALNEGARYLVECVDEPCGAPWEDQTLADFAEEPEVLVEVARLRVGEQHRVGGGAAPEFCTTRVR